MRLSLVLTSLLTDKPTQPWKGWPHHRGLRSLLFSNSGVGSLTSNKNEISGSAVRRDLRFFVLI